jgi:MSHA biogenesis protein MshL
MTSHFAIYPVLICLLTACTTSYQSEHPRTDDVFAKSEAKVTEKPLPALPSQANPALNSRSRKPAPHFFNVSVHEINAREFFMGLVMDSKENIVVHPDVKGTISLVLKNVTIDEVLNVIEKVYGYDCKKTSMGYIIYPATLQTKIFKIDRLDLLRVGISTTQMNSGYNSSRQGSNQQNNTQTNNSNNLNNNSSNNSGNTTNSTQSNSSSIITTSDTDFWEEMDKALHSIIAIDPQASAVINRQTGVVVVRAKPAQLHEVESFIGITQNQIGRQVILEAKIMEVILNDSHQDGINWKVLLEKSFAAAGIATGAGFTTGFGVPDPGKFSSIFSLNSNGLDFNAMVELLETQGKTNVLSNPRISTLNNQKAIIKVGSDEYFVTEISSSNATFNNTSLPTAKLSPFFSGIALDVTPQIDDVGNITLHIHPLITRAENLDKSFQINGEDYSIPTPLSSVRESDSIVKTQNGQVIVLGGLMQESEIENKEGITGLARISGLGHLFRVDKGTTQKSELIILLKASIINDNSDWQEDMDTSRPRMEQLESRPLWK